LFGAPFRDEGAQGDAEEDAVDIETGTAAAEIEAIKQLKARYFRLLDTKQWDDWRLQFCDDCVFDGTSSPFPDADAFVAGVSSNHAKTRTVHHGHMPEIHLTSATTARGIWSMMDYVTWPPDAPLKRSVLTDDMYGFLGYGYYQEEYRKDADGWKISWLRLTRLRVDPLTGPQPEPFADQLPPALDWLPPR
jgi:hypothetical protein